MQLCLGWAATTALGVAVHGVAGDVPRLLVQSSIYLVLALWGARQPAMQRLLASTPPMWRSGALLFLAALVAMQLADRSARTFPLVGWDMYSERLTQAAFYYEYTGVTLDGLEIELNFSREFLALNRQVMFGLTRLAERAERAAAGEGEALRLQHALALAEKYNAKHPDRAVGKLRVWRVTVSPEPFRGRDGIERRLYRELEVGGAR